MHTPEAASPSPSKGRTQRPGQARSAVVSARCDSGIAASNAFDPRWKHHGLPVVPDDRLDLYAVHRPGMVRQAAFNLVRVGAQQLRAGTVHIHANARPAPTAMHRWGAQPSWSRAGRDPLGRSVESTDEAGPGGFVHLPPVLAHEELHASPSEDLRFVLVRSDGEVAAVDLDIEPPKTCAGSFRFIPPRGRTLTLRAIAPRPPRQSLQAPCLGCRAGRSGRSTAPAPRRRCRVSRNDAGSARVWSSNR